MAAGTVNGLAMQLQEYFDRLAPTWDSEHCPEKLEKLGSIVAELNIRPGYHVLDIGSGTGVLVPFLVAEMRGQGEIVAMDFSTEMLSRAQAKNFPPVVRFAQADVVAIPLEHNSVDVAICNSAFPHFDDKIRALREIARVLRQGGRLVICHTMSRQALNQLHRSIGDIVANDLLPDELEVRELMRQAGLKITHFEDGPDRYLVIGEKT